MKSYSKFKLDINSINTDEKAAAALADYLITLLVRYNYIQIFDEIEHFARINEYDLYTNEKFKQWKERPAGFKSLTVAELKELYDYLAEKFNQLKEFADPNLPENEKYLELKLETVAQPFQHVGNLFEETDKYGVERIFYLGMQIDPLVGEIFNEETQSVFAILGGDISELEIAKINEFKNIVSQFSKPIFESPEWIQFWKEQSEIIKKLKGENKETELYIEQAFNKILGAFVYATALSTSAKKDITCKISFNKDILNNTSCYHYVKDKLYYINEDGEKLQLEINSQFKNAFKDMMSGFKKRTIDGELFLNPIEISYITKCTKHVPINRNEVLIETTKKHCLSCITTNYYLAPEKIFNDQRVKLNKKIKSSIASLETIINIDKNFFKNKDELNKTVNKLKDGLLKLRNDPQYRCLVSYGDRIYLEELNIFFNDLVKSFAQDHPEFLTQFSNVIIDLIGKMNLDNKTDKNTIIIALVLLDTLGPHLDKKSKENHQLLYSKLDKIMKEPMDLSSPRLNMLSPRTVSISESVDSSTNATTIKFKPSDPISGGGKHRASRQVIKKRQPSDHISVSSGMLFAEKNEEKDNDRLTTAKTSDSSPRIPVDKTVVMTKRKSGLFNKFKHQEDKDEKDKDKDKDKDNDKGNSNTFNSTSS